MDVQSSICWFCKYNFRHFGRSAHCRGYEGTLHLERHFCHSAHCHGCEGTLHLEGFFAVPSGLRALPWV